MESMPTIVRRRRFRGLALHHGRHPSRHPRRLVLRTSRWGEPPVHGRCRWCYENTAGIHLTWHEYCLDAYRVASGQKPARIQLTMCESCAGPAEELDHRLGIAVARSLSPDALRRAFTIENLRWLCHDCHKRKTVLDRRIGRYLRGCSLDWHGARRVLRANRRWITAFLLPGGTTKGENALAARAA